jgi:hypothetical protein
MACMRLAWDFSFMQVRTSACPALATTTLLLLRVLHGLALREAPFPGFFIYKSSFSSNLGFACPVSPCSSGSVCGCCFAFLTACCFVQLVTDGLKATGTIAVASSILGGLILNSGEDHVAPAAYPWSHTGPFSTFDAAAYVPVLAVVSSCLSPRFLILCEIIFAPQYPPWPHRVQPGLRIVP